MNYGPLEFAASRRRKKKRATARSTGSSPSRITAIGGAFVDVTKGAKIEAVGVYGTSRNARVSVAVRRTSRLVVLVLASQEPVAWELKLAPGAHLQAVLLSNCRSSSVSGAGPVRVTCLDPKLVFKRGATEYAALEREVMAKTGRPIESFHGGAASKLFRVGGD